MHWTSSSIALLASATLLFVAPAAQAQQPSPLAPGEIVRVGDSPILKTEYDRMRVIAAKSPDQPEGGSNDEQLHKLVLQLLVSSLWIEGEAERRKIVVTPGAVYTSYKRRKQESFPREKDLQKFLAETGQTVADIKHRVRLDLLFIRLRDRVVRGAKTTKGQERRFDRFIQDFNARWKAKTVCGQGFETSDCGSVVPLST